MGSNALLRNATASSNLALGASAGADLTGGPNNIDVANPRRDGEAGRIRIGRSGKQAAAFLAEVNGVTVPGTSQEVVISSSG